MAISDLNSFGFVPQLLEVCVIQRNLRASNFFVELACPDVFQRGAHFLKWHGATVDNLNNMVAEACLNRLTNAAVWKTKAGHFKLRRHHTAGESGQRAT